MERNELSGVPAVLDFGLDDEGVSGETHRVLHLQHDDEAIQSLKGTCRTALQANGIIDIIVLSIELE